MKYVATCPAPQYHFQSLQFHHVSLFSCIWEIFFAIVFCMKVKMPLGWNKSLKLTHWQKRGFNWWSWKVFRGLSGYSFLTWGRRGYRTCPRLYLLAELKLAVSSASFSTPLPVNNTWVLGDDGDPGTGLGVWGWRKKDNFPGRRRGPLRGGNIFTSFPRIGSSKKNQLL